MSAEIPDDEAARLFGDSIGGAEHFEELLARAVRSGQHQTVLIATAYLYLVGLGKRPTAGDIAREAGLDDEDVVWAELDRLTRAGGSPVGSSTSEARSPRAAARDSTPRSAD